MPSINREVIKNLENGRREAVSMAELLILARVLGIAPMLLMFPLESEQAEVSPDGAAHTWDAVRWFYGMPREGTDEHDDVSPADHPVSLFEDHDDCVALYRDTKILGGTGLTGLSAAEELAGIAGDIRRARTAIKRDGYVPPSLPLELSGLADGDPPSTPPHAWFWGVAETTA